MKFKKIIGFLGFMDLFQQNVSLKIQNRHRVSISLGKIFTVGIFIFLLYNFFVSDMIMRVNPNVLQQLIQNNKRPEFNFNKENLVFSFAVVDPANKIYHEPSIFNILPIRTAGKNGVNTEQEILETEYCTPDHFRRFPSFFENANMSYALCLKNQNFTVKGYWDEESVEQMNVVVVRCSNNTQYGNICKSKEEIDRFFEEKYFSFWIEDKSFDMNQYSNPINSKIRYFSRTIESSKAKIIRLFIKETTLILDNGIIYSSKNIAKTYSLGNIEYDDALSQTGLIAFFLYSGDVSQIYERRYQRLFDLLASLGGILNVLVIFCSLIVKYFYDWEINELILNSLYVLGENFSAFTKRKSNIIRFSRSIIDLENTDNEREINHYNSQKNNLILSFFERIKLFIKKHRKRTKKENIYLDYLKIANKKLDLISMIKKIEEIEKIKYILFDEKQLLIFNLMSKQYLFLSEKKNSQQKFKYALNLKNLPKENIAEIKNEIKKLKNNENTDWFKKRLINLIE